MRSILIAAALLVAGAAQAADRTKLDGWGPFKFSMTQQQAKAAAGTAGTITPDNSVSYPTEIEGARYTAEVFFTGVGGKVRNIYLEQQPNGAKVAKDDCHGTQHGSLASRIAKTYGPPDKADNITATSFLTIKNSSFKFKDGAEITVSTHYSASGASGSCKLAVHYTPSNTVPKSQF